ncbi:toxin-activating lysine-acyltransferase [Agrobacterium pusense]|uniref:toxin-activating lysine-acyltransferase n=1 Tax=Agrobacterium pusense TaxID=648995 RepID=UPI0035B52678
MLKFKKLVGHNVNGTEKFDIKNNYCFIIFCYSNLFKICCGDRILFMDFIAPFGDVKNIVRDLRKNVFADTAARSVRVRRGAKPRVCHFDGVNYQRSKRDRKID